MKNTKYIIRPLEPADVERFFQAFVAANSPKPLSLFQSYLEEQKNNKRKVWVAATDGNIAGYVTLKWDSLYPFFKQHHIPEIMDLNVLPQYRHQGIATALLKIAEQCAQDEGYKQIGLGFGLYADYGIAQRMYIKNGYIPDGLGITYGYERVEPGASIPIDDDAVLWLTKQLKAGN
jgi:GNAT superfamily N-acetyltransferase